MEKIIKQFQNDIDQTLIIPKENLTISDHDLIITNKRSILKKSGYKLTRLNKDYPIYRIGNNKLMPYDKKENTSRFKQIYKFLKKGYSMKYENNILTLFLGLKTVMFDITGGAI